MDFWDDLLLRQLIHQQETQVANVSSLKTGQEIEKLNEELPKKKIKLNDKNECSSCKKQFSISTLNKYDGKYCGRCYASISKKSNNNNDDKKESNDKKSEKKKKTTKATKKNEISEKKENNKKNDNTKEKKTQSDDNENENNHDITNEKKEKKKYKKKTIPKPLREKVWSKYFKNLNGNCYVCNNNITSFNFDCGHIKAESKGGETSLDNLMPICHSCNLSMGAKDLLIFKHDLKLPIATDYNTRIETVRKKALVTYGTNYEQICQQIAYNDQLYKQFATLNEQIKDNQQIEIGVNIIGQITMKTINNNNDDFLKKYLENSYEKYFK